MAYSHRPMWPEYFLAAPRYHNLALLEGDKIYDYRGRIISRCGDWNTVSDFMYASDTCLFVANLASNKVFPYLPEVVERGTSTVGRIGVAKAICDRHGRARLIRVDAGKYGTRWVSSIESWPYKDGNEVSEPEMLVRMENFYKSFKVGYAPTPAAAGTNLARLIYGTRSIRKHTSLSLAAEVFLHLHSVTAMVHNDQVGNRYDETLYADAASNFLSQYWLVPDGTAESFSRLSSSVERLATWFARCRVTVKSELPLGPFPVVKQTNDWRKRVRWPMQGGTYDTHLWKEQAEKAASLGCDVEVFEGWGWPDFSSDNLEWCQTAYWLKQVASTPDIEKKTKACIVGHIGRQSMGRTHYYLVSEERAQPGDIPVVLDTGEPINIYVREEFDQTSAYMTHWGRYTQMKASLEVFKTALPFAEQGKLVMIDHDAIMTLETNELGQGFVLKRSLEEMIAPPGSWVYQLLHNVRIEGLRRFRSDELTHLPGGEYFARKH